MRLIDADAVEDYLYDYVDPYEIQGVLCAIDKMPTIEKKGKWKYLEKWGLFECSACGGQMVRNAFIYCPWCGAKMRGEDE